MQKVRSGKQKLCTYPVSVICARVCVCVGGGVLMFGVACLFVSEATRTQRTCVQREYMKPAEESRVCSCRGWMWMVGGGRGRGG